MWRENFPCSHLQQGILGILSAYFTSFWSTLASFFFCCVLQSVKLQFKGLFWDLLSLLCSLNESFCSSKSLTFSHLGYLNKVFLPSPNTVESTSSFTPTILLSQVRRGNLQKWGCRSGRTLKHLVCHCFLVRWLLMPTVGKVELPRGLFLYIQYIQTFIKYISFFL